MTLHADPSVPSGAGIGGGTHAYLRELMVGLALQRRRVILMTRRPSPNLPAHERITALSHVFRIQVGPLGEMDKRKLNDHHEESLAGARTILSSIHPVRVIHSVYWHSGRVAMDLSAELGIPYVHTVISNGRRRELEGAAGNHPERIVVETEIFKRAFSILSVSRCEKRDLVELYRIDPQKIIVVGRPVDDAFRQLPYDEIGTPHPVSLSSLLQKRGVLNGRDAKS